MRYTKAIVSLAMAAAVLSPTPATLAFADPAPVPIGRAASNARANTEDIDYEFPLTYPGATWATRGASKEDSSSVYIYVKTKTMPTCRVYVDAWNGSRWVNETVYGYATVKKTGQWRIRSNVYENHGNTNARLSAWANNGHGTLAGKWSPDSWGTYTAINGD